MSEITNLNIKLKNNPYAGYIIPLIQYFNDPKRKKNPFEELAAATLIKSRAKQWNNGSPFNGPSTTGHWCCCPNGCTYQYGNVDCPACVDSSIAEFTSIGPITLYELLVNSAADERLGNPWVPSIKKFEQQLAGMNMNSANAWVYFQQLVDAFYANVTFIPYLQMYKDGRYSNLFETLIGGSYREGYNSTGLFVETVSDGAAGTLSTPGSTIISFNTIDVAQHGSYFLIYIDANNVYQLWYDAASGGGAPITPFMPGYYVSPISFTIDPATAPSDFADLVVAQLDSLLAFNSITSVGASVTFVTAYLGSRPDTDVSGLPVEWSSAYANGTDTIAGETEKTKINFKYALPSNLVGQWFKMYGAADNGVLFYYEVAGYPIDPATLGVNYTTAVPVIINKVGYIDWNDCPTCVIESITTAAIIDTGLFTIGNKEGCCSPFYRSVLDADLPASIGGTANIGALYQIDTVISPAGTVYGSAEDDLTYARIWNNNVVPEMAALGRPIHYLKPVASQGNCICCCEDSACTSRGCDCRQCVDPDTDFIASIMLQTTYPSITEDLKFNTPGSTFSKRKEEECNTCLF